MRLRPLLPLLLLPFAACSLLPDRLPDKAPALTDMDEPLDLRAEPDDEAARAKLALGMFSGLKVADARDSLAAKLGDEDPALKVIEIVENSPAAAAGVQVDDLLLEVAVGDTGTRALTRPSEWRDVELRAEAGKPMQLTLDRGGRAVRATLTLQPRVAPLPRQATQRFREEDRVGVVFRTATEVEARAGGLAPGAGAVLVGMSRRSPWRAAGLRYGDLITAVDGATVAHPETLLQALRAPDRETVKLAYRRGDATAEVAAPLTTRAQELQKISVPLLYSYEHARSATEWSAVIGMLNYRSTKAAWRVRLLWLISFGGGDSDQLLEVDG
ncbi:MAG: PDZ domain-containing protein [Planctomycetes bacterium]|nr:PDZ domain-containing protein [Planctomycetota bacterium]